MQKDKVYVMDMAGVNKICNGTFNDSKVFTRVRLITLENDRNHWK